MTESPATGITLSRTLLLWLAALAVTWASGLEPTWRKVIEVANSFERINLQRNELDRQAIALQQLFESERAQRAALTRFEEVHPAGEIRNQDRADLFAELVAAQTKAGEGKGAVILTPARTTDAAKPCASPILARNTPSPRGTDAAEKTFARAIDRLRNFCDAERKIEELRVPVQQAAREATQAARAERIQKAQADARMYAADTRAKSDVNFELLGVKFTAEPLLASLLWNCFVFAWLAAARQEATQAPAPAPLVLARQPAQPVSDLRVLMLLTLLAWAMQVRVAWLGLGITALTGELMWKALVATAICLLFVGSAALVTLILAHHALAAPTRPHDRTARWLVSAVALLFGGVFAAAWWLPSHAIRLSHSVLRILPLLGALPLLPLAFLWWHARPHAPASRGSPPRRAFLAGSAGAAALILAGAVWWRPRKAQPAVRENKIALRHRRKRGAARILSDREPGFYRKTQPRPREPVIVHYISSRGQIAASDRLPRELTPVPRPVYAWLDALQQTEIVGVASGNGGKRIRIEIPELPQESRPWDLNSFHMALATASWSLEHAALSILSERITGRMNVKRACELLMIGILHDSRYKKRHANNRKRSAPSYRLYDLAAGLAVRYSQPQVLEELKQIIQQEGYGLVFESRIKKWNDVNSTWYRRWHERRAPKRWKANQQVSVF